jgi:chromosome segregation ATPase
VQNLDRELTEKSSRLEMTELNLNQIRAASTPTSSEERLREKDDTITRMEGEKAEMEAREAELTAYIRQAGQDREQIILQYTAYSHQLTAQITSLTEQLNAKAAEVSAVAQRESELVKHVEGLETQLQSAMFSAKTMKKEEDETAVSEDELRQEVAASKVIMRDMEARMKMAVDQRDKTVATDTEKVMNYMNYI